jgi:hypothetical protein
VPRRVAQTINSKKILGAAYAGFVCAGLDLPCSSAHDTRIPSLLDDYDRVDLPVPL